MTESLSSSLPFSPGVGSGRLQLARALRAARGLDGDGRDAEGAVLGRRFFLIGGLAAPEAVDALDDEEDDEGDDEEADDVVDELAVGDDGDGLLLRLGERDGHALRLVEDVEHAREVDAPREEPDERHQYPLDERGDDLGEGGADDDADREVDDVAARDEFAELLDEAFTLGHVWRHSVAVLEVVRASAPRGCISKRAGRQQAFQGKRLAMASSWPSTRAFFAAGTGASCARRAAMLLRKFARSSRGTS